ncbi:hypothetical protein OGATHE_005812 [Ogataea polymorpha]|uniref:Uncharacterized protein n=1 Tax=Ogataea polymorpha TaxID=460523 RepID=A0A9P8NUT7_9ASCO|nr:hypothetical protein OGATHE_005812 [Ogataea polymorpha]
MLIHRICMALRGLGRLKSVETAIRESAATDVESWNVRKFWMLLKMPFPSLMACKMVLKSSSVKTMSAASLATSVPFLPMAIPISASLSAGASFTPSPVMATMSPRICNARTMDTLCSGVVLANTDTDSIASARSCSDIESILSPLRTLRSGSLSGMPILRAMLVAVTSLSPVIMITWTPPLMSEAIDWLTCGRGGSFIPIRPQKTRSEGTLSKAFEFLANPSTRSPSLASSSAILNINLVTSSVSGLISPSLA